MLILASLLGVAFWVWAIDEIVNDDDDDTSSNDEATEEAQIDEEGNLFESGSEDDDNLMGDATNDVIAGLEGEDTIAGEGGDDLLLGGADDDSLTGSSGEDLLIGGEGADTLIGNSGSDIIDGTSLLDEDAFLASLQTAESIDDVAITFSDQPDTDTGDVIQGRGGDDVLIMGSEDSVEGGSGEDRFAGGWWIRGGEPAIVEDYNEVEDILTYEYNTPAEPTITTTVDGTTGDATVFADGEEVIVVLNAGPSFNASNVMLLQSS